MTSKKVWLLGVGFYCVILLTAGAAHAAASFTVINNDFPGEGFNDPTPAAPVGGNTGTTVGQQRLIAFQYAANLWAPLISSTVPIKIGATFSSLPCTFDGAVLGAAGPVTAHRDFAGTVFPKTWYVQALANSLHGADLDADSDDMEAVFNSDLGAFGCLTGSGWYYGLDGNPPSGFIDFVSVLAHELGHGLGFLSLVSSSSGAKLLNYDDAYMVHLEDHTTGKNFPQMTNKARLNTSRKTGNLHWTGANVVLAGEALLAGRHASGHVEMYAPNPVEPGSSVSHFSDALGPDELMEPSYNEANHDVGIALELLADLGWSVSVPTVDAVAPGKITDLTSGSAGLTSVDLSWTAPGNNGYNGTASGYDIRYSSARITESNWEDAEPLNNAPLPGAAGTVENFSATGLFCGRTYYFAVKAIDEAANTSPLSNVLRKKTQACPKLIVSPLPETTAVVGMAYNQSFSVTGGVAPYTYEVLRGLPEPAGMSLAAPAVAGTPAEAKTWRFTIRVTDQIGSSAKKSFALKIRPSP